MPYCHPGGVHLTNFFPFLTTGPKCHFSRAGPFGHPALARRRRVRRAPASPPGFSGGAPRIRCDVLVAICNSIVAHHQHVSLRANLSGRLCCRAAKRRLTKSTSCRYAAQTQTASQRLLRPVFRAARLRIPDTLWEAHLIAGPPPERDPDAAFPARNPQHTLRR